MRSVIRALSLILFGQSLAIPDFPPSPGVRVVGLSDWTGYAVPLARKMNYQNTFYNEEPRLDITSIDPALEGTLDVLISTEVFEHVSPPVSLAFQNSFRLLKPGGALILTVPYSLDADTLEHFPELHEYEILEQDGKLFLHNTTRAGQKQVFENLVFHGGPGQTLEMRIFSLQGLKRELGTSGFSDMETLSVPDFEYGIYNQHPWSLPIIARKPKGV